LKIGRGVDHPGQAFQLELLAKGEGERFGHGGQRKGTGGPHEHYEMFHLLAYRSPHSYRSLVRVSAPIPLLAGSGWLQGAWRVGVLGGMSGPQP
jgi:hypothetical protein